MWRPSSRAGEEEHDHAGGHSRRGRRLARRPAQRAGSRLRGLGPPEPCQRADSAEPEPVSLEQSDLFACYEAAARDISVSGERAARSARRKVRREISREFDASAGGVRV
jgi:hypothetical protein